MRSGVVTAAVQVFRLPGEVRGRCNGSLGAVGDITIDRFSLKIVLLVQERRAMV